MQETARDRKLSLKRLAGPADDGRHFLLVCSCAARRVRRRICAADSGHAVNETPSLIKSSPVKAPIGPVSSD
jgi:hypothetical protein